MIAKINPINQDDPGNRDEQGRAKQLKSHELFKNREKKKKLINARNL